MSIAVEAPKWDMTVVFPGLDSPEYREELASCRQELKSASEWFEVNKVRGNRPWVETDPEIAARAMELYNNFEARFGTVRAYVYSFVSTDSSNETAQSCLGELETSMAEQRKLLQRLTAFLGERGFAKLDTGERVISEHQYAIEKAETLAKRMMTSEEEGLAADLALTGSEAWSRLHGDVTSQMQVPCMIRGEARVETMPVIRAMAYDADRTVRKAAYDAELDAWKAVETVCAAAMNAIKGEVGMLNRRRGWEDDLAPSLFLCGIDRATLDAMLGAARAFFPVFRTYMCAKANAISGSARLSFYDLFAPIGGEGRSWEFDEGAEFVAVQFGTFSPKMEDFARRAVREAWIDAAPQPSKRDGAFCMHLRKDESRLFQTWKPSFGSVSTLAHELGHAYHNLNLFGRTELNRETPMTLAETASIFCETIVSNAARAVAAPSEKLAILEASLQRSTQVVVDITSRFLFEQEVFSRRPNTTLSARELSEIMLQAQEATYGDGMSEERHPYMWAVKPHYYDSTSFYNFPYMFGELFSLGLYAEYQKDADRFKSMYDDLLASTGLADAATLAARFGIDIRSGAFWEGSLTVIESEVSEFVKLVGA